MPTRIDQRYAPAAVVLHHRVLRGKWTSQGIRAGVNQRNGGNKAEDEEPHMVAVLSGRAAQVSMMARPHRTVRSDLEC